MRVLIVDANAISRDSLREILASGAHDVVEAVDGVQALKLLRSTKFEAVISDVLMPGMDGYHLCYTMRRSRPLKDLPFIIYTSVYTSPSDEQQALSVGADRFLTKPLPAAAILEELEKTRSEPRPSRKLAPPIPQFKELKRYSERLVRRLAEKNQELESAERRYRELVALAPTGIYRVTREGRFVSVNAALVRLLGYETNEEVLRLDLASDVYFDPSDRERLIAEGERLGGQLSSDVRFKRRDGSPFWVRVHARAVHGESGAAEHFDGFVYDADEGKKAEEALRQSEKRFRSLIEASRDAIAIIDVEGVVKYASPSAESLAGYLPEDLVGRNAFSLVHPEDLPRLKSRLAEILAGDASTVPKPISFRLRHRDGQWRFFEVVASNQIEDPVLRGFVLSLRDVTERKSGEGSNRKLLLAVEQTGSVILMTDPGGNIHYVNPAFERVYGFSQQEVLGKTPRILKSGQHDEKFYEEFWRRLLAGEPVHEEMINKTRDGRLVTLDGTVTSVSDEDGRRIGFISVQDDITEKRLLESQLRQAQKMEAIGQLAGGVAHDFNNLLTTILGYADLAMHSAEGEPIAESLSEIRKAGERAASLTRQLLAFSRRQVLEPKVLEVNALIEDLQKMLSRLIGEDIELRVALQPGVGRVLADPGQVEQVILNLAVNARDAMPRGGRLTIETADVELDEAFAERHATVRPGPYVMLAVTDTGIGMDAAIQARVFEPFFTTKEKSKGTGLGLATVYGIVKQSGGSIWLYSEPGKGATFKVYLPRVEQAPSSVGLVPGAVSVLGGSETILVVEDEEAVRRLTRRILEARGYRVLEAGNGAEALAAVREHGDAIHLLLTDLVMPDTTGADLAAKLQESRRDIRVLFMSGYTDDAAVRNGLLGPGHFFLQKPFTPDALARKVRAALA